MVSEKKIREIPSGLMGGRLYFTLESVETKEIWRFHCSKRDSFIRDESSK
jgi:hypothetical protein